MTASSPETVLSVTDLHKRFVTAAAPGRPKQVIPAVDGVSFSLRRGQTAAVVGESGSGKSTLARLILKLQQPDAGRIVFLGREVQSLSERRFRPLRQHIQMVFQNPLTSFDPRFSLAASITEVMRLGPDAGKGEERVGELLTEAGLTPRFAKLRPRHVSGGELQRAAIARALAAVPDVVVMDEPTSALDMSIKGQILDLLQKLQRTHTLAYLIVTHDLQVVTKVCDEVFVMYLGQFVETGPVHEVLGNPQHPYTRGLLYAHDLKRRNEARDKTDRVGGTLEYPEPGYTGCRLVSRCPLALPQCREPQELTEVTPGHAVRCWRAVAGETSGAAPTLASAPRLRGGMTEAPDADMR